MLMKRLQQEHIKSARIASSQNYNLTRYRLNRANKLMEIRRKAMVRMCRILFFLITTTALLSIMFKRIKVDKPSLYHGNDVFSSYSGSNYKFDEVGRIKMDNKVGYQDQDQAAFSPSKIIDNNANSIALNGHEDDSAPGILVHKDNAVIPNLENKKTQEISNDILRPKKSDIGKHSSHISSKSVIAICVCATSKGIERSSLSNVAAFKIMLPSLLNTLEYENKNLQYVLFVGYDDDDVFWRETSIQEKFKIFADGRINQINPHLKKYSSSKPNGSNPILPIHFVGFPSKPNHIPFNEIIRMAKEHGADYFVRINDDTEFVTPNWASMGIQALANFNPPNVGVVGPTCHEGNTEIMTHDMVYKTHMAIFEDEYYPDVFDNFYLDDWISRVYGESRTKQIQEWVVKHHIYFHGTRYDPSHHHAYILDGELEKGHAKVKSWIVNKTRIVTIS